MISYLDTQVGVWLAENRLSRIPQTAMRQLERSSLLLSPMVLVEFQYLYDIGRTTLTSAAIQQKLLDELGVRVCELKFVDIARIAIDERWTRDPFDRIIVGHARANSFASLITSDEHIREHYPRAVWD